MSGLTPKAIRLYESRGLLPPVGRTSSGYRLYGEDALVTLSFIAKARRLGLSLSDISEVLELRKGGTVPCARVVGIINDHLRRIDDTVRQLRDLRQQLAEATAGAPRADATICGVIEATTSGGGGRWRVDSGSEGEPEKNL